MGILATNIIWIQQGRTLEGALFVILSGSESKVAIRKGQGFQVLKSPTILLYRNNK